MVDEPHDTRPGSPSGALNPAELFAQALVSMGDARGLPWTPPVPEVLQRALPEYDIISLAGTGGMGVVYKGWQRSLERHVAIKILPLEIRQGDAGFVERFKREARAMARLNHPSIVTVHDAGETADGLLYFVMDFVDGVDVQQLVAKRGSLPVAEALFVAASVCDALAYAHSRGVIHRDIKPSNVMVDAEGRVKVADFGLAKIASASPALLTASDIRIGTPDFMAPEAHLGPAHVDHRADLYALGVMLYQMVTGRIPRGRFEPPCRIVRGIDQGLDAVIDRTLQNDPDARYATAVELRAALEDLRQRTSTGRNVIPPRSLWSRASLVTTAAGLAVAAGGWLFWSTRGRSSSPPLDREPSEVTRGGSSAPSKEESVYPRPAAWRDVSAQVGKDELSAGKLKADREWREAADYRFLKIGGPEPLEDVVLRVEYSHRIGLKLRRGGGGEGYKASIEGRTARLLFAPAGQEPETLAVSGLGEGYLPDAVHEAVFAARGAELQLWIDGRLVTTASDTRLQAGTLELICYGGDQTPPTRFRAVRYGLPSSNVSAAATPHGRSATP